MKKAIAFTLLSLTLIASCTKNKDKENYYNLQLNFKKGIEKTYTTNISFLISSIELYNLTPFTKRVIERYTKKKEIKSIEANIEIKHNSYIEDIDKFGNATLNYKTNKLSIEELQINEETLNINYPYNLPINKNNTTKELISSKGKIISEKNTNDTRQIYNNITKIINKTLMLTDKAQIGEPWEYKLKERYSFNKGVNNFNFIFDIINKITLNGMEDNIIDLSSKLSASIDILVKLQSINIKAIMQVNTNKQTFIDNINGLEKEGHSISTFTLEGTILPADRFSDRHKENFGKAKFKTKGRLNYTISSKNTSY